MRIKVVNTHAIRKVVPYTGVIVKTEPAPAPDEDVPFLLPRKDGKTWIKVIYPSEYVMNKEFVIYLASAKGYPVYVDWGDGTAIYQTTSIYRESVTHVYDNTGIYYISIWSNSEYYLGYVNNPCINLISYVLELEIGKNAVLLQSAFLNATRLIAIYDNDKNVWSPHDIGQYIFKGGSVPVLNLLGLRLDGVGTQCGAYMFRSSSVVSITVGEYVTGLPTGLCYGDTSLREFNATENLKMIGESAFNRCTGLVNVLLPSKEVVTLSSVSAFANVPETCKIRVPEELVDSYKTATNWSEFAEQICAIEAVPEEGSDAG